jgi:hypothetical protein
MVAASGTRGIVRDMTERSLVIGGRSPPAIDFSPGDELMRGADAQTAVGGV